MKGLENSLDKGHNKPRCPTLIGRLCFKKSLTGKVLALFIPIISSNFAFIIILYKNGLRKHGTIQLFHPGNRH